MSLSENQKRKFKKVLLTGVSVMFRPPPMTAVEHADKHFYMSPESSYIEGQWKTVPYQIAILNAMGNDEIREVNWPKAARTGFTKLVCAAICYFLEHKKRNIGSWNPDDGLRDRFSKKHIDNMIRDVKALRKLFPWYGKKSKFNTIENKAFANQRELFLLGGKAAKNFRELSLDVVIGDELSKFDADIENEGDAVFLMDKRIIGSAFGKSIRGSTPGIKGECLIYQCAATAEQCFYRYIPCPRCDQHQKLVFGGKDSQYGLKWDQTLAEKDKAKSAHYVCQFCFDKFSYSEYVAADQNGYYLSETGMMTYDGITFFDQASGEVLETPESVAFLGLWSIYSPFSPWSRIVKDWYKIKKSPNKLKTFVNTTLGEEFEEDTGEKTTAESLMLRREMYKAQVPKNAYYLTCGLDMQDTWVPGSVYGWGLDGERFKIDKFEVRGNPKKPAFWNELEKACNREYLHESGVKLKISRFNFDTGGHFTDLVHAFSRRMGITRMLPCKGASTYGKPIATMAKKPDASRKTYLVTVGTDTAKQSIFSSLRILPDTSSDAVPGCFHLPLNDLISNEDILRELCAESKRVLYIKGKRVYRWLPLYDGIRNEELDCTVYAESAFYCSLQYFGLNMAQLAESFKNIDTPQKKRKKKSKRGTVTGGLN